MSSARFTPCGAFFVIPQNALICALRGSVHKWVYARPSSDSTVATAPTAQNVPIREFIRFTIPIMYRFFHSTLIADEYVCPSAESVAMQDGVQFRAPAAGADEFARPLLCAERIELVLQCDGIMTSAFSSCRSERATIEPEALIPVRDGLEVVC